MPFPFGRGGDACVCVWMPLVHSACFSGVRVYLVCFLRLSRVLSLRLLVFFRKQGKLLVYRWGCWRQDRVGTASNDPSLRRYESCLLTRTK